MWQFWHFERLNSVTIVLGKFAVTVAKKEPVIAPNRIDIISPNYSYKIIKLKPIFNIKKLIKGL